MQLVASSCTRAKLQAVANGDVHAHGEGKIIFDHARR
jgi:hypothetical protein